MDAIMGLILANMFEEQQILPSQNLSGRLNPLILTGVELGDLKM